VSDEDLDDVRIAGFTDADIVAIAGLTAQFLFTNFMSNIAQPEPDFPADEMAGNGTVLASDRS
jgi:alkylhydroperoxidase family enzyme